MAKYKLFSRCMETQESQELQELRQNIVKLPPKFEKNVRVKVRV